MIDYKKELNDKQYEAVCYNAGPLLIIAGAGSGKTKTLTFKTAKLLEDGVNPENILLLTFTNRAANEMVSRINRLLGEDKGERITACTYHSFCVELLRRYISLIGYDSNFTILGSSDAEDALAILKSEYPEQEEREFPSSKAFLSMLSLSKNKEIPFERILDKDEKASMYKDILLELEDKYEQYKEERNLLDYNDIILLTNLILESNPSLRRKIGEQYCYKMIDEYQDTSVLQARFIRNLCMYGNNKITVVGDDAQSIFSFSGAELKNILQFPEKFKDCKIIILNHNYRSTQSILNMANAVVLSMKEKYPKTLFTDGPVGEKPRVIRRLNEKTEASFILSELAGMCDGNFEKLPETAIISRRSFDTFMIESLLLKNKINYRKYGGLKFSEKIYVRDILAYLKVTVNPKDEVAWFRLLNLCNGIGPVTAKKIICGIVSNGPEEIISSDYDAMKFSRELNELYSVYKRLKAMSLEAMLEFLIYKEYFVKKERRIEGKKISIEKRNQELRANEKDKEESAVLLTLAADYKSCKDFLSDLVLEQPDSKEKANVVISTIHSAKGMEFDTVFLMNCISMQQDLDSDNIEEARRCFYVAITRAKKHLYITYPANTGKKRNEPSLFLLESSNVRNAYVQG